MRAQEFITEGQQQKPVIIYPNHKGATIDDSIKNSLPVTNVPVEKLQLWEKHKSMQDPKVADWVNNKLLPELKQNGKLKPLLVWNNHGKLFVIDGNHRLIAYQEAGYQGRVPVQIVPDNMITVSKNMAENMSHSKDGRAVEELKSALLAKRDQLQSASDDQVYDIIDKIMTRIARSHSISGQKLHDMWVDRYKQIPDTWIMNEDVPQPGPSSGAPKKFGPDAKIQTRPMTAKRIISSIPDVPYYNNVVDDWDAKDYSWGVTKKVIEYATYLKQHPETLSRLPPVIVLNGKFEDGAHRVSALWLLQQRMDPKNPLWANAKLNVQFVQQGVADEQLDELFQQGKQNWTWKIKADTEAIAKFTVGDRDYMWMAYSHFRDDKPHKWEIQFRALRKSTDPEKLELYGKTGTGNSAEVMSTAVDITREFLQYYGDSVQQISFDAKENSRIALYRKMVQRLLPNWDAEEDYSPEYGLRFSLTRPKLDENFADGKGPGRPGDSQRHGIPKKATMAELEKAAHAKGRKGQLARWQLNMRRGKAKHHK